MQHGRADVPPGVRDAHDAVSALPSAGSDTAGGIGGNPYLNGSLGFTMAFPEGWKVAEQQPDEAFGSGAPCVNELKAILEDRMNAEAEACFVARGPGGGSIRLMTVDLGSFPSTDPALCLTTVKYWLSVAVPELTTGDAESVSINGSAYARARVTGTGKSWLEQHYYCTIRDGRAWFFVLDAASLSMMEELESVMASARFSRTPSATPEPTAGNDTAGSIGGNPYLNGSLGFTMAFPEGWKAATQQQLDAALGSDMIYAGILKSILKERLSANAEARLLVRGPDGGSMLLMTADFDGVPVTDPAVFLTTAKYWLTVAVPMISSGDVKAVSIDGRAYACVDAGAGSGSGAMTLRCYCTMRGGLAWVFLLVSGSSGETDALESAMASARFD